MRFPVRPRLDDFDNVARAILAGMAGAVTGFMVMLAAVHLPIIIFQLHGDGAGGLLLALGFWGLPFGIIAGAIAGPFARRRYGGTAVGIAMVASIIIAPMIATAAEYVAVGPTPTSPDGCENLDSKFTIAPKADIAIFHRSCPGRTPTIQAMVLQNGQRLDFVGPGNALVLAPKGHDTLDIDDVRVLPSPDSIITFAYDPRLSVVRLTEHVGGFTIRAVAETPAQRVAASAEPEHSLGSSEDLSLTESQPAQCSVEPRVVESSAGGRVVSIFKRSCPGKPSTIEAFIAAEGGSTSWERGNALVVDATSDSPAHPVWIDVARPNRTSIVFDVDRRAHIKYLASRINGVSVEAIGGRP